MSGVEDLRAKLRASVAADATELELPEDEEALNCPTCGGSGKVKSKTSSGTFVVRKDCGKCGGSGLKLKGRRRPKLSTTATEGILDVFSEELKRHKEAKPHGAVAMVGVKICPACGNDHDEETVLCCDCFIAGVAGSRVKKR